MLIKILWQVVYWMALPVRGLTIGIFVWRRLIRQFPAFFLYIVMSECGDIAGIASLIVFGGHSTAYYYISWFSGSLVSAFALLAAYELCGRRLFARFAKVSFYRHLFPIAAILILGAGLLAGFVVVRGYPGGAIFVRFVHGFDGLRLAMLFFLVALMVLMGRQWKRYEFGVTLGLAIDAAGFLVTSGAFSKFPLIRPIDGAIPSIANDLACIIWLVAFLRQEPISDDTKPIDPTIIEEARKSREALKSWSEVKNRTGEE
jgi:hypothetical protein